MTHILALLFALTAGHVTEAPIVAPHPVVATQAYRECRDGHATLYFGPEAGAWERVWEYVGALDCVDDGRMNGSPVPGCDVAGYERVSRAGRRYAAAIIEHDLRHGTSYAPDYRASECAAWTVTNYRWAADHNPGYACPVVIPERLCVEERPS